MPAAQAATGVRRKLLSAAVLAMTCNGAAWAQGAATPTPASDAATAAPGAQPAQTSPAAAQPATTRPAEQQSAARQAGATSTVQQDTVVVTGTRTSTKASQSLTPVDVISGAQLQATGQSNLRDALVQLSPSITRETYAGDTAQLTDALSLHGLTPDHVLVLVNGKRRHTTANIALDGGLNEGSTGVDIDTIPVGLIDHIEILRDGASAQYGSDAIAGVINIILKTNSHGGTLQTTNGQTYAGDGFKNGESANIGLNLGDQGFLDLAAEYDRQNHTVRTGPDDYFGTFQPGRGYYNPIEGNPASTRESVGFNAGYYLGDDVELYGFGTYAHRDAEAYQNYRPPFVLPEVYPNGFVPTETVNENDYSITSGIKGQNLFGWSWDLSTTYGGDHEVIGMDNSANTGLYAAEGYTPTSFHLATVSNTQLTNNLDFSRAFHLPLLPAPVNVSVGVEQRRETYSVGAGDEASYIDGGSQALPGLAPVSASDNSRNVVGTYIDLSTHLAPKWTVDLAGRFEHYSDVGDTTNGKISTRYDFTPQIAVRGSVSSGFRAPSLAEEYYSNVNESPASVSGLLAANSAAAKLIGGQPLKPEESTNYNLGFVLTPAKDLHLTIDAYQIDIRNRIVEGGTASGEAAIAAMEAAGLSVPSSIPASAVSASYFTNGASTRTRGLDFTGTYHTSFGAYGQVDWDLGVNLNTTSVTHVATGANGQPELNAQQIGWLSTSTPKNKIIIGGTWRLDKWGVSLHETRFGSTSSEETYIVGPNAFSTTQFIHFENAARYVTDLEVRYDVTKKFQIAVGANNLFNVYPTKLPYEAQLEGAQYDAFASTIGEDGGFYYLRARYTF
ncbi:TonB-dependent receptor plug domain-containing protein [Paraburkholderia phenazinium]|uniref:Iron complex outermembrane recepter protein n=2 Tax=Paraburkholderia phenazinium TaxID=60549 RepID=A0A1G7S0C9_9BURK|nr:TonB-dependent receptor [Paraburkholderia phenazinium]SDG16468.1 iron complex outermembrane recepter protein [Paraburkholderia phenazinium]